MNYETKKEKQKGIYSAPVLKVVSFQVEGGFAGSGEGMAFRAPLQTTQTEAWRFDGMESADNISSHF